MTLVTDEQPTPKAIRIVRPGQRDFVVPLLTEREYQLGRAETVELYFGDDTVSRVHGFLHFDSIHGAWLYRDAGSTFGSALLESAGSGPGEPIPPRQGTVLRAGQSVALGTGGSRIDLLEDLPAEAPGGAEWKSEAARALEERLRAACGHAAPVLLLGPPGSGKSSAARRIHQLGGRRGRFVSVDCTHLPVDPVSLRSELLGHVQGAFPGAIEPRPGLLSLARGGTLFLQEVDALDWDAQVLLLAVLEGSGEALGPVGAPAGNQPRPDARVISASRQRLEDSLLRRDLARKLGEGGTIQLPALEERREDVPVFALRFLEELSAEQQVECELSPDALAFLMDQKWPGQVRELRSTVRTTAIRNWWRARGAGSSARRRVVIDAQELRAHLAERKQMFGVPLSVSPATPYPPAPAHAAAPATRRRRAVPERTAGGEVERPAPPAADERNE